MLPSLEEYQLTCADISWTNCVENSLVQTDTGRPSKHSVKHLQWKWRKLLFLIKCYHLRGNSPTTKGNGYGHCHKAKNRQKRISKQTKLLFNIKENRIWLKPTRLLQDKKDVLTVLRPLHKAILPNYCYKPCITLQCRSTVYWKKAKKKKNTFSCFWNTPSISVSWVAHF